MIAEYLAGGNVTYLAFCTQVKHKDQKAIGLGVIDDRNYSHGQIGLGSLKHTYSFCIYTGIKAAGLD